LRRRREVVRWLADTTRRCSESPGGNLPAIPQEFAGEPSIGHRIANIAAAGRNLGELAREVGSERLPMDDVIDV
jgi:hypothetical protein